MATKRALRLVRRSGLALLLVAVVGTSILPRSVVAGGPLRLYVKWDASGANNGTSWTDAYRSLQSALDAAAGVGYFEIWVAAGTYRPFRTLPPIASDTFQLHKNAGVYGGFAGTETMRSQRNWQTNVTILNGYWFILGAPHNAYHVVTGSGTDATAVLDGFTVTGGKANGMVGPNDGDGGGMLNVGGGPMVRNVIFSGNYAAEGGGMYNLNSSPTLTNVSFIGNTAQSAGGMFNSGGGMFLTNVVFAGNYGELAAGAMLNFNLSLGLVNVTFSGNSTPLSGGALYNNASTPQIINTIVWGNPSVPGTQIFNVSGANPTITFSDIQGGHAGTGNINSDPMFVRNPSPGLDGTWGTADDDYGDLHLELGSPAIDTGSNAAVLAGTTTDRDGNPRVMGTRVDMGAYETFLKVFLPLTRK